MTHSATQYGQFLFTKKYYLMSILGNFNDIVPQNLHFIFLSYLKTFQIDGFGCNKD